MTKEKTKEEKLVIEGQLKDKIIQDLADDVVELSKSDVSAWAQDAYETAKAEINKLSRENWLKIYISNITFVFQQ